MTAESRNFDSPDETRNVGKGEVQIVTMGAQAVGRSRLEPGWKWSEHVKPIAGTDTCQMEHLGYAVSGTIHVVADGGSGIDIVPGQVYVINPGHDAWVMGDEPFVGIEFQSKTVETFAKS